MLVGAGWAGARHDGYLGSRVGPHGRVRGHGLLLAETPAVIGTSAHPGRGTGLPAHQPGRHLHGLLPEPRRPRHVLLFPRIPAEAFEFGTTNLDTAERLQTLVMVMSDLDLGMNVWISPKYRYPEAPMDRGKVLSSNSSGAEPLVGPLQGCGRRQYRLAHAARHPSSRGLVCFTRHRPRRWPPTASGPRIGRTTCCACAGSSTAQLCHPPVVGAPEGAQFGIIGHGSNHPAIAERVTSCAARASRQLSAAAGPADQRHRARLHACLRQGLRGREQLRRSDAPNPAVEEPVCGGQLVSVSRCNGMPLTAEWIAEQIQKGL